ncbi:TetR/AcrR family transcriptional regulator [Virgisporangium aurantiacum]|uniref:TetR family transcriptional regulator n=1 Tax=Virgisporangium aurantiacum TaxID=175570 RepID=A0A8J3Z5J8_9ACTN|nr:TetR/AcrR family transcriptional regulator [Virgisporangium aurantiacum]GIJ57302.1 TetR family transcriptional regulator [Virgisporangium aurantiacum]
MALTRDVILDSALRVIRERGLARATTKEIAKAAGLSEAALYKHFTDKAAIFLGVLQERSPGFRPLRDALAVRPGSATVAGNLTAIAVAASAFYGENFPLVGSIFAEPAIFDAHRRRMGQLGAGPHKVNEALAGYLRAERELGRVRADADTDAVADLLLGACFQQAFLTHFHGTPPDPQRYTVLLRPVLF